jgi:hypothetical protein
LGAASASLSPTSVQPQNPSSLDSKKPNPNVFARPTIWPSHMPSNFPSSRWSSAPTKIQPLEMTLSSSQPSSHESFIPSMGPITLSTTSSVPSKHKGHNISRGTNHRHSQARKDHSQ